MNLPQNNPPKDKTTKKRRRGRAAYRFVDQIRLRAIAGDGGKGSLSQETVTARGHKKRPDGGHGGRGGHIILVADPATQSLRMSHPVVLADAGVNGLGQDRFGGGGKNKIIRVPCGVVVRRVLNHDEEWDPELEMVRKLSDYPDDMEGGDQEVDYRFSRREDYDDVDIFDNSEEEDDDYEDDGEEEDDDDDDELNMGFLTSTTDTKDKSRSKFSAIHASKPAGSGSGTSSSKAKVCLRPSPCLSCESASPH